MWDGALDGPQESKSAKERDLTNTKLAKNQLVSTALLYVIESESLELMAGIASTD
jgi:hypothetical protein